jgi:hypothetical protein
MAGMLNPPSLARNSDFLSMNSGQLIFGRHSNAFALECSFDYEPEPSVASRASPALPNFLLNSFAGWGWTMAGTGEVM